jgi:hypothetical protein
MKAVYSSATASTSQAVSGSRRTLCSSSTRWARKTVSAPGPTRASSSRALGVNRRGESHSPSYGGAYPSRRSRPRNVLRSTLRPSGSEKAMTVHDQSHLSACAANATIECPDSDRLTAAVSLSR